MHAEQVWSLKFGPSSVSGVSINVVITSSAAMGKSETDDEAAKVARKEHQRQLLVAAEAAAKIARKKHRRQLLEVVACERICLSCWMPWVSPWIADDRKLDMFK